MIEAVDQPETLVEVLLGRRRRGRNLMLEATEVVIQRRGRGGLGRGRLAGRMLVVLRAALAVAADDARPMARVVR